MQKHPLCHILGVGTPWKISQDPALLELTLISGRTSYLCIDMVLRGLRAGLYPGQLPSGCGRLLSEDQVRGWMA